MKKKDILPFPLKPLPRKIALGAIEGEHLEYTLAPTALASAVLGRAQGICFPDVEYVVVGLKHFVAQCAAPADHVPPRCKKAPLRDTNRLIGAIHSELTALRKRGIKGKIPVCFQPSALRNPHSPQHQIAVAAHERFHARASRTRTSLGLKTRTPCESLAITARIKTALRPAYGEVQSTLLATRLAHRWAPGLTGPEEAIARVEEIYDACGRRKHAKHCKATVATLQRELGRKATEPRVLRYLAASLIKQKRTPDELMRDAMVSCAPRAKRIKAQEVKMTKPKKKKPTKKAVCEAACVKSCAKPKKGTKAKPKRCANAPKKLSKVCSSEAFSANMRHSICVGKKPQNQAKAIAYTSLRKGCGTPKTFKGTPKEIVAKAKKKRR